MNDNLEEKIIRCLDALKDGKSLDQVLAMFPEDADDLRPVLETARLLSDLPVAHSIQAQSNSRRQFLEKAEMLQQGEDKPRGSFFGLWRHILRPVVSLAAILLVFGLGIILAAQSALPGDVLYGTKLAIEGVRFSLVRDLEAQERLQQQFYEERLREIRELIENGRQTEVFFEGVIESMEGDHWMVAGIPVEIGDTTEISGVPEVGLMVQIKGRTNYGEMYADEVVVAIVEQPGPTPTRTPSPTMSPEAKGISTETPVATPTATQTNTPTGTATASKTPVPTDTATPTATPTPTTLPTALPTYTSTPTATMPPPMPPTDPPATSTSPPPTTPAPTSTDSPEPTESPESTESPEPTDDNTNTNDNSNGSGFYGGDTNNW